MIESEMDRKAPNLDSRIRGALLGLACGDALGAPAEFKSQAEVKRRFGTLCEMVGGGAWNPGEWTDDTGMALCVAGGILAEASDPVPETGRLFLQWQKTAKDVGSTCSAALGAFKRGANTWAAAARSLPAVKSGRAAGNGSLMRTLPVALAYADRDEMLRQSARLSAMTHWDAQAEACCAIYNLWVARLLDGMALQQAWHGALGEVHSMASEVPVALATEAPGLAALPAGFWERMDAMPGLSYEDLQPSGYAGFVTECLEAAAWCVLHGESLEQALVLAVNLAGEADTIAAVAGGAAGAYWGQNAIPERWLQALYRRNDLEATAQQLATLRHHTQVYAKAGLPAFNSNWVSDHIMAGRNPLTARDVEVLSAWGITHFLDLREPKEWAVPKLGAEAVQEIERRGLPRFNLVVRDMGEPTDEALDTACQFLNEILKAPESRVYVHCRAGMERTAAVLTAYYARQHGVSYDEALSQLRERRPLFAPMPGQEQAVRKWLKTRAQAKPQVPVTGAQEELPEGLPTVGAATVPDDRQAQAAALASKTRRHEQRARAANKKAIEQAALAQAALAQAALAQAALAQAALAQAAPDEQTRAQHLQQVKEARRTVRQSRISPLVDAISYHEEELQAIYERTCADLEAAGIRWELLVAYHYGECRYPTRKAATTTSAGRALQGPRPKESRMADDITANEQDTGDEGPDPMVDGHTREEWRALGSAEVSAWTITPPGGQPMSLDEHHQMRLAEQAKEEEGHRAMAKTAAEEARIREAKRAEDAKNGIFYEVAQSAPLLAAGMNGLEEGTDSMSVSSSEVLEVGGGSMPPSTSCRGR